ncbi:MAG: hypothetical protein U5J63_12990 [Fodinibius sp.]|nr:hypothetical protein [Fodinibius sp.]
MPVSSIPKIPAPAETRQKATQVPESGALAETFPEADQAEKLYSSSQMATREAEVWAFGATKIRYSPSPWTVTEKE